MRRPPITRVVVLLSAAVMTACAGRAASSDVRQGVRGVVLAGPQCPVESAASPCPARPVVGAEVQIRDEGGVVEKVATDERGAFVVALDPGSYTVTASSEQDRFMTSRPVRVQVHAGEFARVTVSIDTGIR